MLNFSLAACGSLACGFAPGYLKKPSFWKGWSWEVSLALEQNRPGLPCLLVTEHLHGRVLPSLCSSCWLGSEDRDRLPLEGQVCEQIEHVVKCPAHGGTLPSTPCVGQGFLGYRSIVCGALHLQDGCGSQAWGWWHTEASERFLLGLPECFSAEHPLWGEFSCVDLLTHQELMRCQVWASRVGTGGNRPAGKVAVEGSPVGMETQAGVCPEGVSMSLGRLTGFLTFVSFLKQVISFAALRPYYSHFSFE